MQSLTEEEKISWIKINFKLISEEYRGALLGHGNPITLRRGKELKALLELILLTIKSLETGINGPKEKYQISSLQTIQIESERILEHLKKLISENDEPKISSENTYSLGLPNYRLKHKFNPKAMTRIEETQNEKVHVINQTNNYSAENSEAINSIPKNNDFVLDDTQYQNVNRNETKISTLNYCGTQRSRPNSISNECISNCKNLHTDKGTSVEKIIEKRPIFDKEQNSFVPKNPKFPQEQQYQNEITKNEKLYVDLMNHFQHNKQPEINDARKSIGLNEFKTNQTRSTVFNLNDEHTAGKEYDCSQSMLKYEKPTNNEPKPAQPRYENDSINTYMPHFKQPEYSQLLSEMNQQANKFKHFETPNLLLTQSDLKLSYNDYNKSAGMRFAFQQMNKRLCSENTVSSVDLIESSNKVNTKRKYDTDSFEISQHKMSLQQSASFQTPPRTQKTIKRKPKRQKKNVECESSLSKIIDNNCQVIRCPSKGEFYPKTMLPSSFWNECYSEYPKEWRSDFEIP